MPDPPPRVYARHLLPFDHGYPLWTPEPGNQFLRYRRDGLRIGDVGVIVPENGSFDVFFNICLPREHPFHRINGVPNNFVPIELDELDVAIYPHAENSGSVISTSSVTTLRTVEPSDGIGNAMTYEFSLSSSEGALLILPEGAESYTLLKRKIFRDVATRNGADWYHFAEQQLGRIITHNSLYLITGCYKSHSWSVAAFHETSSQTGPTEFPAQFKPGQARQGNISAAYTWETMRALHWRVGPLGDWTPIPNQAVFISGFKIAMRDSILGRKRVEVEVDAPPARLKAKKFSSISKGNSRAGRIWRSLTSKSGGNKEAGEQAEAESIHESGSDPVPDDIGVGRHVTVSHIPEALQSFHPSDIVNRYLLRKDPSAAIAVTHDSQWSILFEKRILKPEDLGQDDKLENTISEHYRPVSQDRVVCLQSISDSSIRLTDVGDTVREAWKKEKLDDAEETLSRQIIRRTSSDHSAFAYRALIRARLHHWDAALRDAETSIDIQPSVTAHVARGFALFGQQKYASASHAFNVAVHECDIRDKILVSLIKSIVLFEVGYHAESMAGISDLIDHCPAQIKPACSASQEEMQIRLAALATQGEDYDRALQLLTRAQSFRLFHAVPELETISLICGWRFDNIQFSICRQKCEVLYAAGRTNEAAASLREMTHDLGEDVRTREDNTKWIATFNQRCLKSLESLGDSALALQNYTEAITHYSEALSMGPTTREGILMKRSNAHAAAGAWDDALNDANEAIGLNPLSPWGHECKFSALKGMERHDEAIQAFNDMLSALERLAYPDSDRLDMAIHRIEPRLQTLRNYPPRRNMDHKSIIESITAPTQDGDFQRAADMLAMLRAERDEMVQERNELPLTGQLGQQVGASNVVAGTSVAAAHERSNEQMTASERYQKLHDELTVLIRQNREDDKQAPELMEAMLKLAEQQLVLRPQEDEVTNIPVFGLLEELLMHNTKQRELLDVLLGRRKRDEGSRRQQAKDGGTDREFEPPYSVLSVREDFMNALATEAQKIVEEIARLGEERRHLHQEIGNLMMMQSKYGPGGEFDPDWKPPLHPARASLPPQASKTVSKSDSQKEPQLPMAPPLPPTAKTTGLEDAPISRPAWRSISKSDLQKEPQLPVAPPLPPTAKTTGPEDAPITRPAWRTIKPAVKQRPPTKPRRLEINTTSLLGPSTPRKTSLLDAELPTFAEPPSPTETLPRKGDHAKSDVFSPPHVPLSKPSLGRSSPKFDTSAPSPLSLTFPPLETSKTGVVKEQGSKMADTMSGAIDM